MFISSKRNKQSCFGYIFVYYGAVCFFRGIVKNQAQSLDRRYRKNGMSVTP